MTRVLAWLLFSGWALACLIVALLEGCTCVVNDVTPTTNATDGGLVELDDSGADSL